MLSGVRVEAKSAVHVYYHLNLTWSTYHSDQCLNWFPLVMNPHCFMIRFGTIWTSNHYQHYNQPSSTMLYGNTRPPWVKSHPPLTCFRSPPPQNPWPCQWYRHDAGTGPSFCGRPPRASWDWVQGSGCCYGYEPGQKPDCRGSQPLWNMYTTQHQQPHRWGIGHMFIYWAGW